MTHHPGAVELLQTHESWQEIDDVIDEIATLSKAEFSVHEFYAALLDHAVRTLSAVAGTVWLRDPAGRLNRECGINVNEIGMADDSDQARQHALLLEAIMEEGDVRALPPVTGVLDPEQAGNPTAFTLLVCPVRVEDHAVGVLELFCPSQKTPVIRQGDLRFLAALAELADDFHRNSHLRRLGRFAERWNDLDRFAQHVHRNLDLDATAFAIANEVRRLLPCDRCSVAIVDGPKCRTIAISGQDVIDPRANVVRRMQQLIDSVRATDEPLWFAEDASHVLPSIQTSFQAYSDESNPRTVGVLPLRGADEAHRDSAKSPAVGMLVVEWFQIVQPRASVEPQLTAVVRHGGLALNNAIECRSLPFYGFLRSVQRLVPWRRPHGVRRVFVASLLGLAAVLALVCIPADFTVQGHAQLQPKTRHDVFAAADGIVAEVRVEDGQRVAKGDIVAVLSNSQLDFEFTRVLGEIQTAQKRYATTRAARLAMTPTDTATTNRYNQLTAEEEELKEWLNSLGQQHEVLKSQRRELSLHSPIEGEVLTWNVEQLLEARPVKRGQFLMTVADLDGPWLLEIRVPDDQIGHIRAAQRDSGPNPTVSFILATDTSTTFEGRIEKVAMSTETGNDNRSTVLVTANVDRDRIPQLWPGAVAIPKIQCGRKPLGYVWLHELFETIQKRVLF